MRRSFGIDVLDCPRCGERMQLIAAIEDRRHERGQGEPLRSVPTDLRVLTVGGARS